MRRSWTFRMGKGCSSMEVVSSEVPVDTGQAVIRSDAASAQEARTLVVVLSHPHPEPFWRPRLGAGGNTCRRVLGYGAGRARRRGAVYAALLARSALAACRSFDPVRCAGIREHSARPKSKFSPPVRSDPVSSTRTTIPSSSE